MTAPVLETRGLNKNFGSLIVARGIEIALPKGARYALIGPNGAGKTTLINLITGMLAPDAGAILLGGEDITAGAGTARAPWARPHLSDQFAVSAPVRARVGDACCLRAAAGRTDVVAASRRLSRGNRRSPRNSCHAGTRDGLPSPRPRTALRPRGR